MKKIKNNSLQIYIALIRGINVGGHAIIKMADLKKLFEALGFENVSTYIQSGNVLFSAKKTDEEKLARQIEKKLKASMGKDIKVFILTNKDLKEASANNPFDPALHEKERRCQLMFLSSKPDASRIKELMKLKGDEYKFQINENVLYYAYLKEYDGKRRMIDFEKVLGVSGTSRTWKVVDKLIELSA